MMNYHKRQGLQKKIAAAIAIILVISLVISMVAMSGIYF